jgi:tetratricopeptide (TPR) repeat protein
MISVGTIQASQGRSREALATFQQVLKLWPDRLEAVNAIAWILATDPDEKVRNGAEALRLVRGVVDLVRRNDPKAPIDVTYLETLAAAYAEVGRFQDAIPQAEEAEEAALKVRNQTLARRLHDQLDLYRARKPFRTKPAR